MMNDGNTTILEQAREILSSERQAIEQLEGLLDSAFVRAVETVDSCVGKILKQCKKSGYTLIITSDHGNADLMYDEKKFTPCTTHSINPVPFIICEKIKLNKKEGILADIAPTILDLMNLEKPSNMSGCSLLI